MSLRTILAEYDRIQAEERGALRLRKQEAYEKAPRLVEIDEEMRAALLSVGEAGKRGGDTKQALLEANERIAALEQEQLTLLKQNGFPPDYIKIRRRCEDCGDTGYVMEPETKIKTPCACFVRRQLKEAYASSGVDERQSFETFDIALFAPGQQVQVKNARAICEAYADAFPSGDIRNLVLMGPAGIGKTFLINCIANRVLRHSVAAPVTKVTAYNLIDSVLVGIRQAQTDGAVRFLAPSLLLIDDLGTEPMMNNITIEYLFSIINERQNANKHTVVATNLFPKELQARYGERLFSRLIDGRISTCLRLSGENLRLKS